MIFAIVGEENALQSCYKDILKIGIAKRIKSLSSINFLNEKMQFINAYNKAKAAL
jgi:hypothetical protein